MTECLVRGGGSFNYPADHLAVISAAAGDDLGGLERVGLADLGRLGCVLKC